MRARLILHSLLIWSRAKRRWRHAAIIIALLLWEWYWRSARFGGSHMLQSAYNILIMPCLTFIWGKAFFSRLRQTLFVSGVLKFLLRLILIGALTLTVDFIRLHNRVCHGHFLILSSHDRVGCSSGHDIGLDFVPAQYGAGLCLMATEVLSQDSLAAHETFYRSRVGVPGLPLRWECESAVWDCLCRLRLSERMLLLHIMHVTCLFLPMSKLPVLYINDFNVRIGNFILPWINSWFSTFNVTREEVKIFGLPQLWAAQRGTECWQVFDRDAVICLLCMIPWLPNWFLSRNKAWRLRIQWVYCYEAGGFIRRWIYFSAR